MKTQIPRIPVSAAAALLAFSWLATTAWPQEADTSDGPAAEAAAGAENAAPEAADGPGAAAESASADGKATPEDGRAAPEDGKAAPEDGKAGPDDGQAGGAAAAGEKPDEEGGPLVLEDDPKGSVLDDQTYGGENDDFVPSEEIPVDEPIPYPTDI